jgi:hypothetical protein
MANTFTLIASATTVAGTNTVTFSSIPQTYDDLLVTASTRLAWAGSGAADGENISLSLNSSGNDSFFRAYVVSTPVGGNGTTSNLIYVNDSNTTANAFTSWNYYIHDYTNTSYGKMTLTDYALEGIVTDTYCQIAGQITGVTNAITSLIFYSTASGNFAANSTFYLYGIKRS